MKVAIFFGSRSGTDVMEGAANCSREFGVKFRAYVLSAHRIPEKLTETLKKAEENECEVVITGAGLAAHLPGVIASRTAIPVIGVPIKGAAERLNTLFSMVQMPESIPAATIGINSSYDTRMLAAQMLAIKDSSLREELSKFRLGVKSKFIEESGDGVRL